MYQIEKLGIPFNVALLVFNIPGEVTIKFGAPTTNSSLKILCSPIGAARQIKIYTNSITLCSSFTEQFLAQFS